MADGKHNSNEGSFDMLSVDDGTKDPFYTVLKERGNYYGWTFHWRTFFEVFIAECGFTLYGPIWTLCYMLPVLGRRRTTLGYFFPGKFANGKHNYWQVLSQYFLFSLGLPLSLYIHGFWGFNDPILTKAVDFSYDVIFTYGMLFSRHLLVAVKYGFMPRKRVEAVSHTGRTKGAQEAEMMIPFSINPSSWMLYDQLEVVLLRLGESGSGGVPCAEDGDDDDDMHNHEYQKNENDVDAQEEERELSLLERISPQFEDFLLCNPIPNSEFDQMVKEFENAKGRHQFQTEVQERRDVESKVVPSSYLSMEGKSQGRMGPRARDMLREKVCFRLVLFQIVKQTFKQDTFLSSSTRKYAMLVLLFLHVALDSVHLSFSFNVDATVEEEYGPTHYLMILSPFLLRFIYVTNVHMFVVCAQVHFSRIHGLLCEHLKMFTEDGKYALDPYSVTNYIVWGKSFSVLREYGKVFGLRFGVAVGTHIMFCLLFVLSFLVNWISRNTSQRDFIFMTAALCDIGLVFGNATIALIPAGAVNQMHMRTYPRLMMTLRRKVEEILFCLDFRQSKCKRFERDIERLLMRVEPESVKFYLLQISRTLKLEQEKLRNISLVQVLGLSVTNQTLRSYIFAMFTMLVLLINIIIFSNSQ